MAFSYAKMHFPTNCREVERSQNEAVYTPPAGTAVKETGRQKGGLAKWKKRLPRGRLLYPSEQRSLPVTCCVLRCGSYLRHSIRKEKILISRESRRLKNWSARMPVFPTLKSTMATLSLLNVWRKNMGLIMP